MPAILTCGEEEGGGPLLLWLERLALKRSEEEDLGIGGAPWRSHLRWVREPLRRS